MRRAHCVPALLLALLAPVFSQDADELAVANEADITLGYPVTAAKTTVTLDGRLTPEEWAGTVKVAGFRISGREALAPEQTVMRLQYDADYLYLGVKCTESHIDQLVTKCALDDTNVWHDDCIEFFVDTNHDHLSYFHFIVSAAGVRYDARGFDRTWNAPWKAAASRGENAWFVEVALPFSELGVPAPAPGDVWGFNLMRERRAGGKGTQLYNWADVKGVFHNPKLFGHLWFVDDAAKVTSAEATQTGRLTEGRESRIYVPGGYWVVVQGEETRLWGYRELLKARGTAVSSYWDKLRKTFSQRPDLPGKKAFDTHVKRYTETQQLAQAEGDADPEVCAAATVFLDSLETKLHNLYWATQVDLLNETF